MNYTPFGMFFRTLRIKHNEILSDASKFLNVTGAYISSVECGKRPVPEEWADLITNHYDLDQAEISEMNKAIEESKTSIKINLSNSGSAQRSVAIQFQRSFDEMDDDTANEILKIIERNQKIGL